MPPKKNLIKAQDVTVNPNPVNVPATQPAQQAPATPAPKPASLLSGRKAYLPLEEKKAYPALLQGYTVKPVEQPTEILLGFATFKWMLEDGRVVTDNRSIPRGTDILAQELLVQLNKPELNTVEQEELFNMVSQDNLKMNLWVERVTQDNNWFTNYHFREPRYNTPQASAPAPVGEVPIN